MLRTHSAGVRRPARSFLLCLLVAAGVSGAHGQAPPDGMPAPALAAGLGVAYVAPRDLVNLVNAAAGGTERVAQFTAFGEFFGAFSLPVSPDWILKFEYAYLTGSYGVSSPYGPTDFNVTAHCPSVIVQYVIAERGVYDLKCGIGGGYHFGAVTEQFQSLEYRYTGKGAGLVGELEGNTAFGDHLFAFLGVNLRWSFIGALANTAGVSPIHAAGGGGTTLTFFGAGARLGMSYHF